MKGSDEPVKPLCGSPSGVHTILCLGRRSLCLPRVAVGWVSWCPRQYWSVLVRVATHRDAGERSEQQTVLLGDFLFRVGKQTSRASGQLLRVGRSDPFCAVPGCTRPPPEACVQSPQWLCCVRGEARDEPVLPSSADGNSPPPGLPR